MVDTVIKGTGNSRSIKAAPATLPLTYDEFRAQFISSGIPIDLLGLNAAGLTTKGTDLNKATLLKDTTAALYGLGTNAVPDDVLAKRLCQAETGYYMGTGNNARINLYFQFPPKLVMILGYAVVTAPLIRDMVNSFAYKENTENTVFITWLDNGINFTAGGNVLNTKDTYFHYIAIG